VPANARVEQFVPQAELLPRCAAVVHHAGSGTMFGALAHGLPQVAIPQGADNFSNAEALAGAGVATVLQPGSVTSDTVRAALTTVLTEPSYKSAAQRAAAEIAAMPDPAEVAAELRRRYG
jgi:UDP:flavonoid glycosyltransferase YjiC (YdhE family)